jgi:restriction system protein
MRSLPNSHKTKIDPEMALCMPSDPLGAIMTIWKYDDQVNDKDAIQIAIESTNCIFCKEDLVNLRVEEEGSSTFAYEFIRVRACSNCGWWNAYLITYAQGGSEQYSHQYGATAILRQFDESGLNEPINEVRDYLIAKYEARFFLHPRLFEETVASVFRDLGYSATVTAYSGDEGIDMILESANGTPIGVQVKRYKNAINVEAIRAFTGALVIKGLTRGIYVTTSRFQSGATPTTLRAALRGVPIELFDAEKFLHALKITKHNMYRSIDDMTFLPSHWVEL